MSYQMTLLVYIELDLNIVHLNICGAINKQDGLSRLLTMMGGRNKVNVVSLNETWLRKETEKKFSIPGYNYIGRIRQGKNGGRVCLLVSEELRFRELPSLLPDLVTFETISIEVKTKKSTVVVVSMYRPPNASLISTSSDVNKIFNILKSESRPVAICADHNLDLLKLDNHPKTQEFLEVITDSGFISSITKPTRITHHSATLIDNIFINRFLADDYQSLLLYEDISDHLPCVVCVKNFEHDRRQPETLTSRKIYQKAVNLIQDDLSKIDWEHDLLTLNCEDSFNLFHDQLLTSFNNHAPERTITKKVKKSVQPWITTSIKKCICKQKRLCKEQTLNPCDISSQRYKDYRSCLQRLIRNCK